ncbi:MAG: hypothetical protein ACK53L_28185, partial [Pirellulaceae bacterium]
MSHHGWWAMALAGRACPNRGFRKEGTCSTPARMAASILGVASLGVARVITPGQGQTSPERYRWQWDRSLVWRIHA